MKTQTKRAESIELQRVRARQWLIVGALVAACCPLAACASGGSDLASDEAATAAQPLIYDAEWVGCSGTSYIRIRTGNYYCTAEGGGGGDMTCNRSEAGEWELFRVVDMGGGKVALETSDGIHYVVAEGGGGGGLYATRTVPGPWETFVSASAPGTRNNSRSFQTYGGYFVVAENDGGSVMNADRTAVGPWEVFFVECVH